MPVAVSDVGRATAGITVGSAVRAAGWLSGVIGDVRRGFERAPRSSQTAFAATATFASTIGLSRGINHLREEQRPAPALRVGGRMAKRGVSSNDARIHHYLPGLGVAFGAGAIALLTHPDRLGPLVAVPFGFGVGLTTDELRLLANRSDPYWGGQWFALTQAGLAAVVSIALMISFHRTARRWR